MRSDSPELVLAAAWEAFVAGDGHRVAALATAESLAEYREHSLAWLEIEGAPATRDAQVQMYAGVRTADELRSLDAAEMLTRGIRALPERLRPATVLKGHIAEGPDRVHVLLRLDWKTSAAGTLDAPGVASLRRVDGEWRLELDPTHPWGMPAYDGVWYSTPPAGIDTART